MTRRFNAHFENGVLVPEQAVDLPERQSLTVTVDEMPATSIHAPGGLNDPGDPMPAGGAALIDWWARHRIQLEPAAARMIIQSKAYQYNEEPDDADEQLP